MTALSLKDSTAPALPALAATMLLASLGISIASVALPTLSGVFAAPVSTVQWVVLAYLMSATVTIVLVGRFGDMFGHRRVLIIGLALFSFASILCASAPNLGVLITGRALQGMAGAVLMTLPISIVRDTIAPERTGSAMGLLASMSAFGTALGPALGGLLIASFGWRSAFILLAVLSVLVFVFTSRVIPPLVAGQRDEDKSMDWLGAGLLGVSVMAYALATAGAGKDVTGGAYVLVPIALAALTLFIIVQARSMSPLVPVTILRDPVMGISLVTNLMVTTVMMTTLVVGPFFLFFGAQLKETLVGLVMAVGPVTAALAGVPAGRLTDRFGAPRIIVAGLIQITIGLICLALLPRFFGAAGYVAALIVLTPGFQLFLSANNTATMAAAGQEQRGMMSGLLGLSRNLGFMTGASVMATLFGSALGSAQITSASVPVVTNAFTTTFLVAAGMAALALILVLLGRIKTRG